jgi:hypothetical protein
MAIIIEPKSSFLSTGRLYIHKLLHIIVLYRRISGVFTEQVNHCSLNLTRETNVPKQRKT